MSTIFTQQRRPWHVEDTGEADGLSARGYNRRAHNENNLAAYCARSMLVMQHWGGALAVNFGVATERYVAQWPQLSWPWFYDDIRFVLGARLNAQVGAEKVRFTLRAYRYLYNGGAQPWSSAAFVDVNSLTHAQYAGRILGWPHFSETGDIQNGPVIKLVLFAQQDSAGTTAMAYTLKAWPVRAGL